MIITADWVWWLWRDWALGREVISDDCTLYLANLGPLCINIWVDV